jgi:hypothetical protein
MAQPIALHRLVTMKRDATATIKKLIAKAAKTGHQAFAGGATAEQLAEWANW